MTFYITLDERRKLSEQHPDLWKQLWRRCPHLFMGADFKPALSMYDVPASLFGTLRLLGYGRGEI